MKFGPILYLLGDTASSVRYRLLCVCPKTKASPSLMIGAQTIRAIPLLSHARGVFWSFEFELPKAPQAQTHSYTLSDESFTVSVPGSHSASIRVAYTSCNGSEADRPSQAAAAGRNSMWSHLASTHAKTPFQVLVQGGDQIYADSIWQDIDFLRRWKTLPREQQYTLELPAAVIEKIRDYYISCYLAYWAEPEVRSVLATIASIMIWDDHDIFDGWGSWNAKYQASPVYQGLFKAAREAFFLFQRGQKVPPENQTASLAVTLGDTCFVAPDLRSERSRTQVIGPMGWSWLENTLHTVAMRKKQVVFISSVPLATSHFSALDPILTGFPSFIARRLPHKLNPKRFADDIYDQWRVLSHRQEWLKLMNTLLDFADKSGARVSTVSGEIHLGARSTIKRGQQVIDQFIASAIAHKPAGPFVVWCCEWLSKGVQNIDERIDIRMEPFFPKGKKRYLRARNWLAIELSNCGAIRADWYAEHHSKPFTFEREPLSDGFPLPDVPLI